MLAQNLAGVRVDLAERDSPHTRPLKPKAEPTDTGEKI
jgi:hypothetical protein